MGGESLVCIRVYFDEPSYLDVIAQAEKAGIRTIGLKPIKKVPHGWAGETIPNTKYLAKFLKFTLKYWKENEAERLRIAADLSAQEKAIAEERKRRGIT